MPTLKTIPQKVNKQVALDLINTQLQPIAELKRVHRQDEKFEKWWRKTRMVLTNIFGESSLQLSQFEKIPYTLRAFSTRTPEHKWQEKYVTGLGSAQALLESLVSEIETFWLDQQGGTYPSHDEVLEKLFERFHAVTRQLRSRHSNRPTLNVTDEYDVQDLLHALLQIDFEDIRSEEWTPSYAGGSSRIDFILNDHGIVIEIKKTRPRMTAKELGDQLLIDIMRYKAHPNAKQLYCFVYDPDGLLPNPTGIERDLSKPSDDLDIRCFIRPK